jgi:diguanylate cyclase (GGDEF)-like protein
MMAEASRPGLKYIHVSSSPESDSSPAGGYAPFAQLVKMLLPSAHSIAIYDPHAELVWCSDGFERPDLRTLLEQQRASDTLASRGRVETTAAGIPVFVSALRAPDTRPLGSVVIELGGSSRSTPSMIVSMLRPVLDCLEALLDLEHSTAAEDRSAGLELLLTVDEHDREDTTALQELIRHCTRELGCVTGALVVPDKNLEFSCSNGASQETAQLLDRTQKHLLAWVRLNNRPMVVNRAGGDAQYKILSCPLRDPYGAVVGLVALFRTTDAIDFEPRDVRILEFVGRKAVAVLSSEYDALTGLPNRSIFERRAQRALDRAAAALLYVDIDKLAAINEAFGLSAGDEVIHRVGALLPRAAGAEAFVSRIAGDRFAVVLPGCSLEQASAIGARLLAATGQLGYLQGSDALPVAVSVGAAVGSRGERLPHLLAAAELACKRAKAEGGARIAVVEAPALLAPVAARQDLASEELSDALQSNQFQLEAQPIVSLRARGAPIIGYEVLVRLRSSTGEVLAPDKFLDACAQYGLTPALDRWVLFSVVEALRPHAQALSSSALFFTINVSEQSLKSRKYPAFVLETLAAAALPARLFCFELQESIAVGQIAAADALIRELAGAGAKVALDDFGLGLSSLAHLKHLPVSFLKIDGRFVRRIATDRIAESIVSGIARAARTLGVMTVAEHVESAAATERLRELDVTLGQGFHLGRPQPIAQAIREAVQQTAGSLAVVETAARA